MDNAIYCIRNVSNNKEYIGVTKDYKSRMASHFWALRRNQHPNSFLQEEFSSFGELSFECEILESHPDREYALKREYEVMVERDTIERGYNKNQIKPAIVRAKELSQKVTLLANFLEIKNAPNDVIEAFAGIIDCVIIPPQATYSPPINELRAIQAKIAAIIESESQS